LGETRYVPRPIRPAVKAACGADADGGECVPPICSSQLSYVRRALVARLREAQNPLTDWVKTQCRLLQRMSPLVAIASFRGDAAIQSLSEQSGHSARRLALRGRSRYQLDHALAVERRDRMRGRRDQLVLRTIAGR
jgi:hypothetical protein